VKEAEAILMAGRDQVAVPELMVDIAAGLAGPTENEGFLSGNVRDVLGGNAAERSNTRELGGRSGGGGAFREGSTREFERVQLRH
jgi:hypothetical protein